ncbi:hypothetical protein BDW71DRAFT_83261 [Aspergillus fruticulosus]
MFSLMPVLLASSSCYLWIGIGLLVRVFPFSSSYSMRSIYGQRTQPSFVILPSFDSVGPFGLVFALECASLSLLNRLYDWFISLQVLFRPCHAVRVV